MRNQQNDAQSNSGKPVSSADAQQECEHSAQQDSQAIDHYARAEERGQRRAEDRTERSANKALPSERPRRNRGLNDDDGGDRSPIRLGHLEHSG